MIAGFAKSPIWLEERPIPPEWDAGGFFAKLLCNLEG
jgi:hypothetical protein